MSTYELDRFVNYLSLERGFSENTVSAYRNDIAQFMLYLKEKNIDFKHITLKFLINYLLNLKKNNFSVSTILRKLASIKAFFRFLFLEESISSNPALSLKFQKREEKLPSFLSYEDINIFLSSPDITNNLGIRDKALLELLYGTGMRVSEIIGITLDNLNLNFEFVKVFGKGGKERIIPIGKEAIKYLKMYLEIRPIFLNKKKNSFLFLNWRGNPLTREAIWKIVKKYALLANIKKNVFPHIIRHSFATHLLKNKADLRVIQELLGHSDISTTQIYTHLDTNTMKEFHRKYHPRG